MPGEAQAVYSPNDPDDLLGHVTLASPDQVDQAIEAAQRYCPAWTATPVAARALALQRTADAYEEHIAEFCALLCREAGKTLSDAISEVREAVDFLRYYAAMAIEQDAADSASTQHPSQPPGHGIVACISPWNFPLAIFTGQIAGALASGNVVIAKPAEQTPLVAARAIELMLQNGIPAGALQLLLGTGPSVGRPLTADARIDGVCFTGSTDTSRMIERALAGRSLAQVMDGARPNPLFMAETGGLNAMIVDSSALTEQVVRDAVASAFQSAGQRCSALRMLYVQKDAYSRVLKMLTGAMDTLHLGHPWQLSTDVGPVIDADAHADITSYIERHRQSGDVLHQVSRVPSTSDSGIVSKLTIAPTLIRVNGIADLEREIFGPVLHLASYEAHELSGVVEMINARGFGLTFGLHTRIDDRVQQVVDTIHAGNVYVNRNQIGAVVGSQPFGGEGLSGTGPKAGGPWYVARLMNRPVNPATLPRGYRDGAPGPVDTPDGLVLPGPTGESNHWRTVPRGTVLLLGKDDPATQRFKDTISSLGCHVVMEPLADMLHDSSEPLLQALQEHAATVVAAPLQDAGNILRLRQHLAMSEGPLIPLVDSLVDPSRFLLERHVCIDTTAAGGNASLLGSAD